MLMPYAAAAGGDAAAHIAFDDACYAADAAIRFR